MAEEFDDNELPAKPQPLRPQPLDYHTPVNKRENSTVVAFLRGFFFTLLLHFLGIVMLTGAAASRQVPGFYLLVMPGFAIVVPIFVGRSIEEELRSNFLKGVYVGSFLGLMALGTCAMLMLR